MLKTRLTTLLGIRYPIISAPMALASGGGLATAVSSAGALGTFGAVNPWGAIGTDYVQAQIRHIRSHTDRPFGVGFITQAIQRAPKNFDVVLDEGVHVIIFSFADPEPWLIRAKQAGAVTVCQVQSFEAARRVVAAGADVLVAQGNEAGGHTGTMNLLPFLVRLIEAFPTIPIVAAGGVATGRSLAAVLAAGADGVLMGTAFLAAEEAGEVPDDYKKLIVQTGADDTVYTPVIDIMTLALFEGVPFPPGVAVRVYNNTFVQEWHGREQVLRENLDRVLPGYVEARERRDFHTAPALMGESTAFIDAIRPVANIVAGICDDAERLLRQRAIDVVG